MKKPGCPVWFILSDGEVFTGYMDVGVVTEYLNGKPCEFIGQSVALLNQEEGIEENVVVRDILVATTHREEL